MALSPSDVWGAWTFEPGVLVGLAVPTLWYACGVRSLWHVAGRGRGIGASQLWAFGGGLFTLIIALVSPLDAMGDALFSAHMTQHLLLILVVAPLIVISEPLLPMLWAVPTGLRRRIARWWRHATGVRTIVRTVTSPGAAWALHVGALFFWHIPAPYGWALRHDAVHALEHVSFLGTAILFWWAVLQPTGRRRLSYGMSVVYVSTAGMLMGALGAILTLAPFPWYVEHLTTTAAWHLSPLQDQQLAGVIMWVPASIVYLGAVCWFFVKWLGADAPCETGLRPIDLRLRAADIRISTTPGHTERNYSEDAR